MPNACEKGGGEERGGKSKKNRDKKGKKQEKECSRCSCEDDRDQNQPVGGCGGCGCSGIGDEITAQTREKGGRNRKEGRVLSRSGRSRRVDGEREAHRRGGLDASQAEQRREENASSARTPSMVTASAPALDTSARHLRRRRVGQ